MRRRQSQNSVSVGRRIIVKIKKNAKLKLGP